jgi:hypothetical protein
MVDIHRNTGILLCGVNLEDFADARQRKIDEINMTYIRMAGIEKQTENAELRNFFDYERQVRIRPRD